VAQTSIAIGIIGSVLLAAASTHALVLEIRKRRRKRNHRRTAVPRSRAWTVGRSSPNDAPSVMGKTRREAEGLSCKVWRPQSGIGEVRLHPRLAHRRTDLGRADARSISCCTRTGRAGNHHGAPDRGPAERKALVSYILALPAPAQAAAPRAPRIRGADTGGEAGAAHRAGCVWWLSLDGPGVRRHITVADLPAPFTTPSSTTTPSSSTRRQRGAEVPPGFHATLFSKDLQHPRLIRVRQWRLFVPRATWGKSA